QLVFLRVPGSAGGRDPLAVLVAHPKAATGRLTGDVVERTSDRAGAALDAVAEADQILLLLRVPLVDPGRAEVVAVLAGALLEADVLVHDLDVRLAGVLGVLDREELVGELLHQAAPNLSHTRHIRRMVLR